MKKILFTALYLLLSLKVAADDSAATLFGADKLDDTLKNGGSDLVETSNNMLWYVIGLFYFIAVAIGIYAGFQILTSLGDDEKVKKGRQTLIYSFLGLVVIFLASQIVNWLIITLSDPKIVWA